MANKMVNGILTELDEETGEWEVADSQDAASIAAVMSIVGSSDIVAGAAAAAAVDDDDADSDDTDDDELNWH